VVSTVTMSEELACEDHQSLVSASTSMRPMYFPSGSGEISQISRTMCPSKRIHHLSVCPTEESTSSTSSVRYHIFRRNIKVTTKQFIELVTMKGTAVTMLKNHG
jgi:hypothetical protein